MRGDRISQSRAVDFVQPGDGGRDETGAAAGIAQTAEKVDHCQDASPQCVLKRFAFLPVRLIAEPLWSSLDGIKRFGVGQGLPDQQVPFRVSEMTRLKGSPCSESMFGQDPETEPVDRRDIGPLNGHSLFDQPVGEKASTDTLSQFPRSGFREGDRKNFLGAHKFAFYPVGELRLDPMRFARPRTGRHNHETLI